MKRLSLAFLLAIIASVCYSQKPIVPRANGQYVVSDSFFWPRAGFNLPAISPIPTLRPFLQFKGIDTAGSMVFSKFDSSIYFWQGVSGWVKIATGSGGGGASGIDTELAVGQALTTQRDIPTAGYGLLLSKASGTTQTTPALTIGVASTAGTRVEYLRFNDPIGGTNPGTPYMFYNIPTLNPDASYNNVYVQGVNPFGVYDNTKPGMHAAMEPFWYTGGSTIGEYHMFQTYYPYPTGDKEFRAMSFTWYPRDSLGNATAGLDIRGGSVDFATPKGESYANVATNRATNTSSFSLVRPKGGGTIAMSALATGIQIAASGYSGSNNTLSFNLFNAITLPGLNCYLDHDGSGYFGNGNSGIIANNILTSAGNTGYWGSRNFQPNKIWGREVFAQRFWAINYGEGSYFDGLPAQYVNAKIVAVGNDGNNATPLIFAQNGATFSGYTFKLMNGGLAAFSQQLGVGTDAPNASAKLDVSSTSQGFLPPRMTTTQRDAISGPATGLTIFCTDCTATDASTGVTQSYNGSAWKNYW